MKKTVTIIVSSISILAIISCGSNSTTSPKSGGNSTGTATVSGTVVDYYGERIEDVSVSLNTSITETDAAGAYSFPEVQTGSYTLNTAKEGLSFLPDAVNIDVSGSNVTVQEFIGLVGVIKGGHNGSLGYCAKCHG